ncbi:MAG: LD-carboxypeptidase [Alphaproteobacteria bacterium]|nr:LD-carboxypeptidase [Alphaproteobacteria bacterium]
MKKIALIAPSSPASELTPDSLTFIQDRFADIGYKIHLESHALDGIRYLAGTDSDRADDVMRAFADPEIDVVMTVRGGYGSPRLLDKLDYDLIRQNTKPFWTISDGTALQTALFTRAGISGYSGMQALFLLNPKNDALFQTAAAALQGSLPNIPIQQTRVPGIAQGITIGGNLTVFEGLLGTPYFPDMTGKILVLEDINEQPYRIDRMLTHLRLSNALDTVAGVVLGDFSACLSKDPADGTVEDVFDDFFHDFAKPVVHIHYGHRNRETVFPIGKSVLIDTEQGFIREVK